MSQEATSINYLNAADKFWIGERLFASRQLRGFDVPSAAHLINLSQAQVLAIESGSQGPFLSVAHYIQSVRRYAETMNTPQSIEVSDWLLGLESAFEPEKPLSSQTLRIDKLLRSRLSHSGLETGADSRTSRFSSVGTSFALIVLGFAITLPLMWGFDHTESNVAEHRVALTQAAVYVSLNREPEALDATSESGSAGTQVSGQHALVASGQSDAIHLENSITPPVAHEQVTFSVQQGGRTGGVLGLNFTEPCWVQITSVDGQVTERLYSPSEVVQIDLQRTASLVIGNVMGANAVTEQGKPVDFDAFVSGGNVARLRGADLASLVTHE